MQVGQNPLNPTFVNQLQQITSDGKISRDEYKQLKQMVQNLDVPDSEKTAFLKMADKMKNLTNVGFFSNGTLEKSEMANLEKMAGELKDSQLVQELFGQFKDAANPVADKSLFGSIGEFFRNLFSSGEPDDSYQEADCRIDNSGYGQSCFDPNGFQMPQTPGSTDPNAPQGPTGVNGPQTVGAPPQAPGSSNTYTSQWEERQAARAGRLSGNPAVYERESQANCGPASASMIMKQFGLSAPSLHDIRRSVGGRLSTSGNESGAFALSTDQVASAVIKQAVAQGKQVTASTHSLPSDSRQALAQIKDRLDRGEKVILLTGGFGGTAGHYTVIKGVNPDGTFIVDDPARGPNQIRTADELQRAMTNRREAGRGVSQIIAFQGA